LLSIDCGAAPVKRVAGVPRARHSLGNDWESVMTMIRRLLCLALLLCASSVQAQTPTQTVSKLDAILSAGVVRVGIPGDYRPFAVKDATGAITGLDIDMAGSLAKALGVRVELVATKWGDLLTDLAADRFDIGMGGISITLERQKKAFFSTAMMRTGKSAIARCADVARYGSLAAIDQAGVRVISNPGGTNERFDRATLKAATIVMHPDNLGVWGELLAGRADVMITDNVETRLQQKLNPGLCAINPEAPFDFGELGYMLPRDIALKLWVDQWLHIQTETGELSRATARWLN
jgi:cyclohexadienyl dehydratase